MQAQAHTFLATQWLCEQDWAAAFAHIEQWVAYDLQLPEAVLADVCSARLGQAPKQVIVEHPWQTQWLTQQCTAYFAKANIRAPMPVVLTLAQWVNQSSASQARQRLSKLQVTLMLCNALKTLQVKAIQSDAARFGLAQEMVHLISEMSIRQTLCNTLAQGGQDALQRLSQSTWRSREAQWVAAAHEYLEQANSEGTIDLPWQSQLASLSNLAQQQGIYAVLPAPHPGLMMQAFLSQTLHPTVKLLIARSVGALIDPSNPTIAADCSNNQAAPQISINQCSSFEQEAHFAAQTIAQLLQTTTGHVGVIAHDRILGRRVAALLTRQSVAVEDRVGWALSTTIAASAFKKLSDSWYHKDPLALMAWLALPIVSEAWNGAAECLSYLRRQWHAQPLMPDGAAFLAYALNRCEQPEARACLHQWSVMQERMTHPKQAMTVAHRTRVLLDFLEPIRPALQADRAGEQVWRNVLALCLEPVDLDLPLANPSVSMGTWVAALDDSLESERYSMSNTIFSQSSARAIFVPMYEAAWMDSKHIVMLGCNESHLPAKPSSNTPLLSSVRFELGLPLPQNEPAIWQHLKQSGKSFYASFTPHENSYPIRLSPYLMGAAHINVLEASTACATQVALHTSQSGFTLNSTQFFKKPLEHSLELARQHLPKELSVTQLAAIVQCPYRFALSEVYGIRPLDEPALWPSHAERGNLLHAALQHVQSALTVLSTPTELHHLIQQTMLAQVQDKLPLSGRYAALLADSQRTIHTFVMAHQHRQSQGWRMFAAEHTLQSTALINGVCVHGKLDRIDCMNRLSTAALASSNLAAENQTAYAVLDYKTSSAKTLKEKQAQPLLDPQLLLYAKLMELSNLTVQQAAYWRLSDELGDVAASGEAPDQAKHTVLEIADLPTQLRQVTQAVQAAWGVVSQQELAHATPSPSSCQYCPYQSVCRAQVPREASEPPTSTSNDANNDAALPVANHTESNQ